MDGEGSFRAAGVVDGGGFKQQDCSLVLGGGAVFDAFGDNEELAFSEIDDAVPEVHPEAPVEDEEELVFVLMGVPDEFAFDLDKLDVLPVEFADDTGVPVIGEEAELLAEVDGGHASMIELDGRRFALTNRAADLPGLPHAASESADNRGAALAAR